MRKDVAYFRTLPYTRRAEPREEGEHPYWLAWVVELPSVEIHGATREEALQRLDDIFDDCVQAMLDAGEDVPEPRRWPEGLFDRAAQKNARRMARKERGGRAPTQASSITEQFLDGGDRVEPFCSADAAALTGSAS